MEKIEMFKGYKPEMADVISSKWYPEERSYKGKLYKSGKIIGTYTYVCDLGIIDSPDFYRWYYSWMNS